MKRLLRWSLVLAVLLALGLAGAWLAADHWSGKVFTPSAGDEELSEIGWVRYGNDDGGTLSAWYVFATLGFYPVEPASAQYVLGRPLVERAVVTAPGRPTFVIMRRPTEPHEALVTWNNAPLDGPRIDHESLVAGGVLAFPAP